MKGFFSTEKNLTHTKFTHMSYGCRFYDIIILKYKMDYDNYEKSANI